MFYDFEYFLRVLVYRLHLFNTNNLIFVIDIFILLLMNGMLNYAIAGPV